jgi:DNA-directed RNA polymerase subunit alpha
VLLSSNPKVTQTKGDEKSFSAEFVISPLEPGLGYTLGNSIRRTLLSMIPGAAVTNVRLVGAQHEFSVLEGVKEDVTEILLNIKEIVVSSENDEPITLHLKKSSAGQVTAGDIELKDGVQIHNPELVVANISAKAKFEAELTIERGRGYVQAVLNRDGTKDADIIPVDSIYSPVVKVSYRVEATREGERTDFDKLTVVIDTKQSITARAAFASAGITLKGLFALVADLDEKAEGVEVGVFENQTLMSPEMSIQIEELELTVRSYNCLKREGINTVSELTNLTEDQLMNIRNFGSKSVDEVRDKLYSMGLRFRDSLPGFEGTYFSAGSNDAAFTDIDEEGQA